MPARGHGRWKRHRGWSGVWCATCLGGRWLSAGAVLVLTVGMWALWMTVFVLWPDGTERFKIT